MARYTHTRRSFVWPVVLSVVEALAIVTILLSGAPVIGLVVVFVVTSLLIMIGLTFGRLTAAVDDEGATAWFGRRWPRRSIAYSRMTSGRGVRNSAWVGRGLRWIPRGGVWNVSGPDAVELSLDNGKVRRLGADEPDALLSGRVSTS